MNRKPKAQRKMEFEPKIPVGQPVIIQKPNETIEKDEKEIVNKMRGLLAPKTFSDTILQNADINMFMMHLPESLQACSLLVFDDGSYGLRKNGIVYECDSAIIGDGMAVEISDKVRKLGDVDLLMTGYEFESPENV